MQAIGIVNARQSIVEISNHYKNMIFYPMTGIKIVQRR